MQPMRFLDKWLSENINEEYILFKHTDLRTLFPQLSNAALKTLLSRAAYCGIIKRLCRGIYLFGNPDGRLLFRAASLLRADDFNYISLETALSDIGIISQVPINWITIMSSGRSNLISCGKFGTIEFVHTIQKPGDIAHHLTYDSDCGLWRSDVSLALRDMKRTHRNCDLIDWSIVNEFI